MSGLTTAVRLQEDGHEVRVVARAYLVGTTSWVATAIWHLFWVEVDERVERWAAATLAELIRLADDPRAGITMVRGLECIRENTKEAADFGTESNPPLWKKVVPSYQHLTQEELIKRLPDGYPTQGLVGGYEIEVPIADMSVYLPYLMSRLRESGVELVTDTVSSFEEARGKYPCEVIVNCTGLGARDLTGDGELRGIKGQIVRVGGVAVSQYIADDHSPVGMTYVLPRQRDIVLGGTEDVGVENDVVDLEVGARIIDRCVDLVPALARAQVHEHMAGIRPYRTRIRLEPEGSAHALVIHNYGHGGSGVSLSWGCAEDVANLVTERTGNGS